MSTRPVRIDTRSLAGVGIAAGVLMLAACSGALEPGDTLAGSWVASNPSPQAELAATSRGVEYSGWCQRATFAPVVIGTDGKFHSESTSFDQYGNIKAVPGEQMVLDGQFVGKGLRLQINYIIPGGPQSDPVVVSFEPGSLTTPPVCTA